MQATTRKVTFNNSTFLIEAPEGAFSVLTKPAPGAVVTTQNTWQAEFKGRTYLYTSRGLTVKDGTKSSSISFKNLTTTNRLFNATEIKAIEAQLSSGNYRSEPEGISGWVVTQNSLFLLLRWTDAQRKPWLEAVVEFGSQSATDFRLAGRFRGFSTATGAVSDRMTMAGDLLAAMTVTEEGLGVATLRPTDSSAGFKAVGEKATDAFFVPESAYGIATDTTGANTTMLSILDTQSAGFRLRKSAEIRGEILEYMAPCVVRYRHLGRERLLNISSGTELPVPIDCGVKSTPAGILLWVPKSEPRAAALYSSTTFRTLARWTP